MLVVDLGQVAAGDADDALGGVELLDQQAHDRGLARAGGADQEDELLAVDRERGALQADVARVIALGDGAEIDDGVGSGRAHRGLARSGSHDRALRRGATTRARSGGMCRASARRGIVRAGRVSLSGSAMAGHSSDQTRVEVAFFPACKAFCTTQATNHGQGFAPKRGECDMPIAYRDVRMTDISTTTVAGNGLPVYSVSLPGTRALTVLVAFDAGARTERVEENGMAHFLEHLVFKGGEKYATYKDVNETAERLGGMLNAYTSHDLVAFHITVRAESAPEAIDLLSDFVARPKLDAEELDRERGVVIQEINRAYDQPSTVAEYLIDKAAFGDHPLGRTVLGPEENLRSFTREAIVSFRERRWAGATGGAFLVGNIEFVPGPEQLGESVRPLPNPAGARAVLCRHQSSPPRPWWSSATPTSRTCA